MFTFQNEVISITKESGKGGVSYMINIPDDKNPNTVKPEPLTMGIDSAYALAVLMSKAKFSYTEYGIIDCTGQFRVSCKSFLNAPNYSDTILKIEVLPTGRLFTFKGNNFEFRAVGMALAHDIERELLRLKLDFPSFYILQTANISDLFNNKTRDVTVAHEEFNKEKHKVLDTKKEREKE